MGCYISNSLAIVLIASWVMMGWDDIFPTLFFHKEVMLAFGVLLCMGQMISPIFGSKGSAQKVLSKIMLGAGMGILSVWVITLPTLLILRIVLFMLWAMSASFLATFRIRNVKRACSTCIYHGNWDICYGFRSLNKYMAIKDVSDKKELRELMFDKMRVRALPYDSGPLTVVRSLPEPRLQDDCQFIYHDESFRVPWVPATGLEVERLEDVEKACADRTKNNRRKK